MRLAIMQPYLLPYLGYFQLIRAVDKFVLYDDVSYIKGGWINRNKIWARGKEHLFTIPLSNGNSGVLIHDVAIAKTYERWRRKFLNTVQQNYSKALNFDEVYGLLEGWLGLSTDSIAEVNFQTLVDCCNWLGIETAIVRTSRVYKNRELERAERLVDICQREGALHYINMAGGLDLYSTEWFWQRGINLDFLSPCLSPYQRANGDFVPGLSILDFMMHVKKTEALDFLSEGEII